MELLRHLSLTLFLITLVACGGGSLEGGDDPNVLGGGETSSILVGLTVDNTNVSSINPATVTAKVTNDGLAVAGVVVAFSTTLGVLSPESGTALTNDDGEATIQVHPGTVQGAGEVVAVYSNVTSSPLGFTSAGDGTGVAGKVIVILSSNLNISSASPAVLSTTVTNAGESVVGEVVTFTSTLGVLDPIIGTALTNTSGEATIVLSAGTVKGAGLITVTTSTGESNTLGFSTEGDGTVSGGDSLTISSFTNSTAISNANPAAVVVHFEQANGTALANEVITFTSTLGILDPTTGTALSDASGDATIVLSAGIVKGAGVLTATSNSGNAITQGFFTQGDGSTAGGDSLTISSFTNSTAISNASPATVTVHFEQANGTALANEVITFTSTLGTLEPATGTALTNTSGDAIIKLLASTTEGAGVLTAVSSSGVVITQGFYTQGDGAVQDKTINLTISSPNVSDALPATLTATVLDKGVPVLGEVITFTSTLGVLDPVIGTVITKAGGVATIILSAGEEEGAGVISAMTTTGESDNVGFETAGDGVGSGINIRVILTNSSGDVVDQISSISSGNLTALVTGITEAVIVTFTTDMGSIPIPTAIATAGSNFEASVELLSGNSLGAGTINVSLISGETDNLVFSIGASDLGIGNSIDVNTGLPDGLIGVPNSNISAGSTAGLTVGIWDVSNASVGTPAVLFTIETVEVTFSSGCSNLTTPIAIIDSPVSTKGGIAQSTYLAQGCEDDDTVTATANAGGTTLSATGVITIDSAANGSIEFISATPQLISLKGVGGTESSTVVFRVLDTNGNPVSNEKVSFSLNTTVGGITFSPTAADTDSNGLVQTVINSGSVHTSVRVRAELTNDSAIFTQSSLLVISTGIPDQDSFSLSASIFNPEAWNIDGTEVTITARLADAFNNPAPDGTAVAFTTEGGAIEDSCVTNQGVCSVIWTSQNVRPDGQELGETNNGPTMVKGTVDISNGLDFSKRKVSFEVTSDSKTHTVTLDKHYTSKFGLLVAVNEALKENENNAISVVNAVSGFEDVFELVSTDGFDITVTDTSTGAVTTQDLLGIANGTTYYFDPTTIVGSVDVAGGKDLSINDITFTVTTAENTDTILLNLNYSTVSEILTKINEDLATSGVIATEFLYAGASYIVLTSAARLDIKITDNGGIIPTFQGLGFADGTTFPTRINSSLPQVTNFMGQTYGGRATISATAIGEESFPDLNGNGVYDSSEKTAFLGSNGSTGLDLNGVPFDLAESFIDNNEDGVYNPATDPKAGYGETGGELEKFDDFNDDQMYNIKDNEYNGSLCGTGNDEDTNDNCSANKSINVRGTLVLVMSGSHPRFVTTEPLKGKDIDIIQDGTSAASVIIADIHNQPMPAGTTVIFEAAVGSLVGISTYTWPSESSNRGSSYAVTVKGVENKTLSGPLTVTVTTPSGTATTYTVATISITPS